MFIKGRNRNFPRKRICFCCELLCLWISDFLIILDAPIGSILSSKHEYDSQSLVHDKYPIALINSESVTTGYLPKFMSKLAHFFVEENHAGKIRCEITGSKSLVWRFQQKQYFRIQTKE